MQIQCPSPFFLGLVHDFRHSNVSYSPSLYDEVVGELPSCFLNLLLKSSLFVFQSHKTFHVEDATRTQHNSTGKVAFHHSIFCQGVSWFISFANEVTNFYVFTIYHLPVSLHSLYFNTGHLHWHSNFFAIYFVYFNKALPFFVTLPTPFLITILLTQQVIG